MPKNVMKLVKPSPHRARNAFDLSHRSVFTQNFGELLPSMCIETIPGDHFEISIANLIRAIPMVTSPFLRAKQHVDLWFVPYKDLWHNFDNFMTQKAEPVSSALNGFSFCPHATIYDLWNDGVTNAPNDICSRPASEGAAKLLNLLGYAAPGFASSTDPHHVNLWRLAAYNYIWYNEYRQAYYDDGSRTLDSSQNASYLFNFDKMNCTSEGNSNIKTWTNATITAKQIAAMCQMRYRCWKKDLFTGLMPASQFGNVSIITSIVNANNSGGTYDGSTNYLWSATDGIVNAKLGSNPSTTVVSNVDVLALRKSEAVQIWRENALRAGNRVADNMMAHYGVRSDFRDHRPTFIGSVDAPLNIGDIAVTANGDYTGNTNPNKNPGDICGKGLSSMSDNRFKFDSKDFGVIMAISSILPEAEYNAQGIDRMNQLIESEDYFVYEFENLGLEAVGSQNFVNTPSSVAKVVGYAPRYYGYKTKLDKCFGSFMSGGINAPWCSPKYDVSAVFGTPPTSIPLNLFYVNPAIYNVNFVTSIGNSDQFLNDSYNEVDAVRAMSVLGLPFS